MIAESPSLQLTQDEPGRLRVTRASAEGVQAWHSEARRAALRRERFPAYRSRLTMAAHDRKAEGLR